MALLLFCDMVRRVAILNGWRGLRLNSLVCVPSGLIELSDCLSECPRNCNVVSHRRAKRKYSTLNCADLRYTFVGKTIFRAEP